MEEREETARTPSPFPLPLCTMPTSVSSPTHAHSAPTPRPCPASMLPRPSRPALPVTHRQTPAPATFWTPPLQPAPAYKTPLRAHHRTHTIPSNLPDNLSSLRSLSFVIASSAGELLDAGGATAFGHRWKNGRRKVEEECRQNLFRPAPSSSSSPTSLAVAVLFSTARR
jgi:hypothetical protein